MALRPLICYWCTRSSNMDSTKEQISDNISVVEAFPVSSRPYHKNLKGDDILENGLNAGLKNRMINLIAIAGVIGPGVFIGMSFISLIRSSAMKY